jgi:hypothetical protein
MLGAGIAWWAGQHRRSTGTFVSSLTANPYIVDFGTQMGAVSVVDTVRTPRDRLDHRSTADQCTGKDLLQPPTPETRKA